MILSVLLRASHISWSDSRESYYHKVMISNTCKPQNSGSVSKKKLVRPYSWVCRALFNEIAHPLSLIPTWLCRYSMIPQCIKTSGTSFTRNLVVFYLKQNSKLLSFWCATPSMFYYPMLSAGNIQKTTSLFAGFFKIINGKVFLL